MLIFTIVVLFFVYVITSYVKLKKQGCRKEAVVLLFFSLFITCYFIPVIEDWMPTSESLNTYLYKPISLYVRNALHVQLGVD
ncbi:hypothetical protein [Paenibacillus sp. CF384]|uniref:hypothetical protein n=1 Tax=Paenibacillus sp. CF384 TaxID=1884382 RepID=UPI00089C3BCC|nr:hypothetical protein [Paenibacillus sp. CF384]SDW13884.1 hypothetical protein SAMN05518855_1001387 [Paenibacillus sp. CF384]